MYNWIKQKIKNILNYVSTESLDKQEFSNFKFSVLCSLVLACLLVLGVDESGHFKSTYILWMVNFLISIKFVYISSWLLIPMFLFLMLKAYLFNVPNSPWFTIFAQIISGFFYSFGCAIIIIFFVSFIYGIDLNINFITFGIGFNLLGYALYTIFQSAIQRTSAPKSIIKKPVEISAEIPVSKD